MIEFRGAADPARENAPEPVTERGYLAMPESGGGPGVLVLHAWWGLNETFRQVCQGLASEGFIALGPDLYGDGVVVDTVEEAERRTEALDVVRAEQAVLGALDRLALESKAGRVGIVGFSLGAPYALWAARKRPAEASALVLFYGTGSADGCPAAVLGHFAADDPHEPSEAVTEVERELRRAGRLAAFHRYDGVGHWFAEPDRPEFDAAAAELAWQRTLEFLRRELAA